MFTSLDIFSASTAALLLSSFFLLRTTRSAPAKSVHSQLPTQSSPALRTYVHAVVISHTIYILYKLIVARPPNIFTALRIPILATADQMRLRILSAAGAAADPNTRLPAHLEYLLSKLGSFDARMHFVRFGQTVLVECEHCSTFWDYTVFALSGPLLQYVRTAAVAGLVTIRGSWREHWRTLAIGSIIAAALAEAYYVLTAVVQVPEDGISVFWWHDTLWTARHLFFLVLPLVVHFLLQAPPPKPSPVTHFPSTLLSLDRSQARLFMVRTLQGAVSRDSSLRNQANSYWESQRTEAETVMNDEGVQTLARKLRMGFDLAENEEELGDLRKRIRGLVRGLTAELGISQFLSSGRGSS